MILKINLPHQNNLHKGQVDDKFKEKLLKNQEKMALMWI